MQFGDTFGGWAIRFDVWRGLVEAALTWCSKHNVRVVFHNVAFDALALRTTGILVDWSVIEDTMIYAHLGNHAEQMVALKTCGVREFGQWAAMGERLLARGFKEQGWTWETVPMGWQPYPMYAVIDTCVTAMLWEQWLDRRVRYGHLHDLEIATIRIATEMVWRGIAVDNDHLASSARDYEFREEELRSKLATVGVSNPSQNAQIADLLTSEGFVLPKTPKTGKDSVTADVLRVTGHPVAAAVVQWRELHKIRVTYFEGLLRASGGGAGRGIVHCEIRTMAARTGRMSIAAPPMQQLPRDNLSVRDGIIPRDDDEVLLTTDYSQIEMRLFAGLTKDAAMQSVFREADLSGSDFFVEVGKDVYQDPGFQKKDLRRTLIKSTMYGAIYTAGIETMAATAGVSLEAMLPVRRALSERYPSLQTLGMEMIHQAFDGDKKPAWWTRTPYGRVMSTGERGNQRVLVNYTVQGHAAEILKTAMVRLDAAGLGSSLVLPIHDEIVMSVPKKDAEEIRHVVGEVMSGVAHTQALGVEVPAEPSMPIARLGDAKR